MVILYAARHRLPAPALARWLLALGIVATLAANVAHGWSHGPIGAAVAAWPAARLVGNYEFLLWLIRTAAAGRAVREPGADHQDDPANHTLPGLQRVPVRHPASARQQSEIDEEIMLDGLADHATSGQRGYPKGTCSHMPIDTRYVRRAASARLTSAYAGIQLQQCPKGALRFENLARLAALGRGVDQQSFT